MIKSGTEFYIIIFVHSLSISLQKYRIFHTIKNTNVNKNRAKCYLGVINNLFLKFRKRICLCEF